MMVRGRTPAGRAWRRLAAAMLLGAVLPAGADILHLANGGTLDGMVTELPEGYAIQLLSGRAVIPRAEVVRLEREEPAVYHRRQARACLERGALNDALAACRAWEAAGGDAAERAVFLDEYHAAAGRYLLAQGEIDRAREALELVAAPDLRAALAAAIGAVEEARDRSLAEARAAVAAGRLGDAVTAFRRAALRCPGSLPAFRAEFVAACVGLGESRAAAGRPVEAAQAYDLALTLDPARIGTLQAVWVRVKLEVLAAAAAGRTWTDCGPAVTTLADIGADDPGILVTAGDIALTLDRPDRAAVYYGEALVLLAGGTDMDPGPPGDAAALRDRAHAALAGTPAPPAAAPAGEEGRLVTAGFRITAPDAATARRTADVLAHFLNNLRRLTGLADPLAGTVCTVELLPDEAGYRARSGGLDEQAMTSLTMRDGVLADITILTYAGAEGLYLNILAHELGHAVVSSLTRDNGTLPLALQEGFAVMAEPEFRRRYYDEVLAEAAARNGLAGVGELLAARAYPASKSLFYAQSHALVAFLAGALGMDGFIRLAVGIREQGLVPALKAAGFAGVAGLEKRWRDHLRQGSRDMRPAAAGGR